MSRITLTIALAGLGALNVSAHFIFLELPPGSPAEVHMRFAEEPLEATAPDLQERSAPMKVTTLDGAAIEFVPGDEYRLGQVAEAAPVVKGSLDYGVLDRGDDVFMLKYHAKAARGLKEASTKSGLPVDLLAEVTDGTLTVTVLHHGKPFEGAELVVNLPNVIEQAEGKTGADGTSTFPIEPGGWVGIRAMVPEETAGNHDGKAYTSLRHYGTLTFPYSQP